MKKKRKLWWLALSIGIAALWVGLYAFVKHIDAPVADAYPTKSEKNVFMLYNNGCCFHLEDFTIWLTDENEDEYHLFSHATPPLWRRFTASFPQDIAGASQAVVSFGNEYAYVAGHPAFVVMDFESMDVLKRDGLLLVFGDGTLEVRSGRREAKFSYDKEPWADDA